MCWARRVSCHPIQAGFTACLGGEGWRSECGAMQGSADALSRVGLGAALQTGRE